MKKILQQLFEHKVLDYGQAKETLENIGSGACNEQEITAFITVFLMRSITIDELKGFRDALLGLCRTVDLGTVETLDIVGTGGDGKNTFNISTLSCFVAAGAGQKVAKHGNYGSTSITGASNVMEKLGYRFKQDEAALKKELETAGICFLHAPMFHPALKVVGGIRKNIGVRTFFNMLGPLVNPASPAFSLIGTYNMEMARIYTYMLQQGERNFTIVHSLDGYDEVSLTSDTKVITQHGERTLSPYELGKRSVMANDILGGTSAEESASIFLEILKGNGSWSQNAVVLANTAVALETTGKLSSYGEAYQAAVASLESGAALRSFRTLIDMQPIV